MAEASVSTEPETPRPKFFCHKCNEQISNVREDFTCPLCLGGFIEEIHDDVDTTDSESASPNHSGANVSGFDIFQLLRGLSDPAGGGRRAQVRVRANSQPFRRTRSEGNSDSDSPVPVAVGHTPNFSFVVEQGGRAPRGGGHNPENPMEHMLLTFLNDLITGLGGGGTAGGGPVMSNIGDYVWSANGLDQIVTQLMNQMDGTGPPPLASDKIDTLPDCRISQEQIDRKLQCSVCWEDFKLDESVKKLECDHLFHPDCIIPWLKLHGTCPICRKDLTGQVQEGTNATPSARFEPMHVDSSGSSTSSTGATTSSNNDTTTASDSSSSGAGSSSRLHGINTGGLNTPPVALFNQLLDPLLSGLAAAHNRGSPSTQQQGSTTQPGSGQQPRDQSGRRNNFDSMDFEFD